MRLRLSTLSIALLIALPSHSEAELGYDLAVMNAKSYQAGINVLDYWKSEKLDGIRAIWTGSQLVTRNGHRIFAPLWFTESLPNYPLEGELWAGRGNFHVVQQTVLDKYPNNTLWKQIDFMIFDMPEAAGDYQKRYYNIVYWVEQVDEAHIKYIEHTPILSEKELFHHLDNITDKQGEGLMLRKISCRYQAGRSTDMLKLKKHQDTEATVVGYKVGNGKFAGMMGSLLVRLDSGLEFYIGSGFSELERQNPPKIGSVITFRYNGLTQNGVPKFARYVRERVTY
ncbi:DNA ligase [Vibrio sp. SCSIO 43135]|uniref:DNA ligase n=1 Tax=Vibrio sp. SCSIO 43135 TaxID=2819096 RepID=UPI002074FCB5|nr:DNA ligase [Vibrio sp. SCSIO 43135]USD39942.1 DNA ligase [Vibrio sp. SCSIO 43135]